MTYTKKQRILKVLFAIVALLLAAVLLIVGYVWQKLSLIQYADDGTKSSVVSMSEKDKKTEEKRLKKENAVSDVKGVAKGHVVVNDKRYALTSKEGTLTAGEAADNNYFVPQSEAKSLGEKDVVAPTVPKASEHSVMNILLIGTDESTTSFSSTARSDSIMLLSVDKGSHSLKLVGFERAIGVPISVGKYTGQYEWLSYMMREGGAALLLDTVRETFRIDVAGYIRVNLRTFEQIVDSCGGVDITLTPAEAEAIGFEASGSQHLDGKYALKYSRLRKIDSDWGRIDRQKKVIQSAITSAKSLSASEINDMLNAVLPLVQTNLSKADLAGLILEAPNLAGTTLSQMTLPKAGTYGVMQGFGGKNMLAVDFDANAKALQDFLY